MGDRSWRRAVWGFVIAAGFAACGTANPPGLGGSAGDGLDGSVIACSPGRAGCACAQAGEKAACGEVIQHSGTQIICSMGTSTCSGQTWGPCVGSTIVTKSVGGLSLGGGGGLHLLSLGSGTLDAGTCTPCDPNPNCTAFLDNPTGIDAGPGLAVGDGGTLQLIPVGGAGANDAGVCSGLACNIVACPANSSTRVTGKVFDPNGASGLPVYNAMVWVPVAVSGTPLTPFIPGVACETCDSLIKDKVLSSTLTAPDGSFTLTVPTGVNFDLVVQAGRWRRVNPFNIPIANKCTATAIPDGTLRFPKSHAEGDMPAIAIATGNGDALECQLLKMGIASSEFTAPGGGGQISMYQQNGATVAGSGSASTLVASAANIGAYNAVLWPCDNSSPARASRTNAEMTVMVNYLSQGGRLYASHWSAHDWLENASGIAPVAPATGTLASPVNWEDYDSPGFHFNNDRGPANVGGSTAADTIITKVNQSFQKGTDFATWIFQASVGANSQPPGGANGPLNEPPYPAGPSVPYPLPLGYFGQYNWRHMASSVNATGTAWLTSDTRTTYSTQPAASLNIGPPGPVAQLITFNTPVGAPIAQQCGRVVFPVMHVSSTSSGSFPGECGSPLPAMTPADKILEFMLFDATGCLQADTVTPTPPQSGYSGDQAYTRDFQAVCPAGTGPVWHAFSREDKMPLDSKIVFSVQTATTQAGLSAAASVPLTTDQGPLDQSGAYVSTNGDVDTALRAAVPLQKSSTWLRVSMDLFASSDGTQTPFLYAWMQAYDCSASE